MGTAAPRRPRAPAKATAPGKPYPLGACYDGAGVNFALFSRNAARVEACLEGRSIAVFRLAPPAEAEAS